MRVPNPHHSPLTTHHSTFTSPSHLPVTLTLTLTLATDPNPGPNQVAYAGLFLAQHFAQACRGAAAAGGRSGGGGSCYKFVHDGRERCVAGGRPRCDGAAL